MNNPRMSPAEQVQQAVAGLASHSLMEQISKLNVEHANALKLPGTNADEATSRYLAAKQNIITNWMKQMQQLGLLGTSLQAFELQQQQAQQGQ
jgi:hypothetical protein